MVDILYDVSLLQAIEGSMPNKLMEHNIEMDQYIFKKYKIDSVQFAKSNVYYASDYNEYKSMFEQIRKRLEANTKSVDSLIKLKKKKKTIKKVEKQAVTSRDTTKLN